MKSIIACDAEFDDLYNPNVIWCVVCRDINTNEEKEFLRPDLFNVKEFVDYLKQADLLVGHNFLEFDLKHLNNLIPNLKLDTNKVFDTLITSKFLNYNIDGGHSLKKWGERLNTDKAWSDVGQEFFKNYSPEMLERCKSDVEITHRLYNLLSQYINSTNKEALRVEHQVALLCQQITENGFDFDADQARIYLDEINLKLKSLYDEFQTLFPPRSKLIREITPKATKSGAVSLVDFKWLEPPRDMTPFNPGSPFCLFRWEHFNPGSKKQIIERMWEYGWKPTDKTKGHIEFRRAIPSARTSKFSNHNYKSLDKGGASEREKQHRRAEHFEKFGWKVNETNLATLPDTAPEGPQKLKEWLLLDSRRSTLEEFLRYYNPNTGCIHGRINHIGAWTHRKSHTNPNMANIPTADNPCYGEQFRSLFRVRPGYLLLGCDATGIQLRVLAHYLRDPEFTHEVTQGDIHVTNISKLGVPNLEKRHSKRFIYSWILGAGIEKSAEVLNNCSPGMAKEARENFLNAWPALRQLKEETCVEWARQGYFIGLDGRKIPCSSDHLMISGLLQEGESTIMKHAELDWTSRLSKEGVPFWLVDDIHDEWQTRVLDNPELAEYIGKAQVKAIEDTGVKLGLHCPFTGEYKIGHTWFRTH